MIRREDLQEAIAECEGQRNPNANTCIKLAAYHILMDHMEQKEMPMQSFAAAPEPEEVQWEGDSEFARECRGLPVSHVMPIMDELMETLQVIQPRLYDGVMRKIRGWG